MKKLFLCLFLCVITYLGLYAVIAFIIQSWDVRAWNKETRAALQIIGITASAIIGARMGSRA